MELYRYRNYITKSGQQNLKSFQYQGGSISIFYLHIWSPLCEYLVQNVVPPSIAPNVITLVGFIPTIICHLLFIYYSPNLDTSVPSWLIAASGFSILFYQILDNLDGKQARATQNSTPLGMLFDHGIDSLASWIISHIMMCTMLLGPSKVAFYALAIVPQVPFFIAMWCQYHMGVFQLHYVNGVDEGLVFIESVMFFSAIVGQEVFQHWVIPGTSIHFTTGMLIFDCFLGSLQTIDFLRHAKSNMKEQFSTNLYSLLPAFLFVLTFVIVAELSPANILSTHFWLVGFGLSLSFSNLVTHLQFAFLSKDQFNVWNPVFLIPVSLYCFNILASKILGVVPIPEVYLAYFVAIYASFAYAHMVYCVFMQISTVLDIQIFKINQIKAQ